MRVGLCGFPGSGKSTVFQALSPGAPSRRGGVVLGNIKVPDPRVDELARYFKPQRTVYAETTFMDVQGAGGRVGGAFPPNVIEAMRHADVLVHVVRTFESPYVSTPPDPQRDIDAFEQELILLDLGILEKRAQRFAKEHRKGLEVDVNATCLAWLEDGQPLREFELTPGARQTLQGIQLLSLPPLITLFNIAEDDWETSPWRTQDRTDTLAICGALEAEIAQMPAGEQQAFLDAMGLGEPARNGFIRAAYRALNLVSFLTVGPDECRAWPVRRGSTARKAAGRIHSDLERGFIRAEVYRLEDLRQYGTEAALKAAGKIRVEGKDYIVQDGDILHVRFNV